MSVNSVQQFLNVRDSHLRVVSGNVHADQMVLGGITVIHHMVFRVLLILRMLQLTQSNFQMQQQHSLQQRM